MRDHAHRVQELAAEKLHTHDAAGRIVGHVLLQEQQILRQPVPGMLRQKRLEVLEGFDQHDARAAAALLGLEQGRKRDLPRPGAQRVEVVERPHPGSRHAEPAEQRGLRRLGKLQCEGVGAVQHAHAADLQGHACRASAYGTARVLPRT